MSLRFGYHCVKCTESSYPYFSDLTTLLALAQSSGPIKYIRSLPFMRLGYTDAVDESHGGLAQRPEDWFQEHWDHGAIRVLASDGETMSWNEAKQLANQKEGAKFQL